MTDARASVSTQWRGDCSVVCGPGSPAPEGEEPTATSAGQVERSRRPRERTSPHGLRRSAEHRSGLPLRTPGRPVHRHRTVRRKELFEPVTQLGSRRGLSIRALAPSIFDLLDTASWAVCGHVVRWGVRRWRPLAALPRRTAPEPGRIGYGSKQSLRRWLLFLLCWIASGNWRANSTRIHQGATRSLRKRSYIRA